MIKPVFRFSKWGLFLAGFFLLLAGSVFAWILYASATNPADSGESGILLLPFAMPWIMIMPKNWLGLHTGLGAIFLNFILIYLVFGGLRFRRT